METHSNKAIEDAPRDEGNWRVLPFEGHFEFAYRDVAGRPSLRHVHALEVKVGPAKLLLGGVDEETGTYRGFRVDRIGTLKDAETGEVVSRNILDWLLKRAERHARRRPKAA